MELLGTDTDSERAMRWLIATPSSGHPRQPHRLRSFLHQFSDAAPGTFLDFASRRGKDACPFA
jgi:hypothetical protein